MNTIKLINVGVVLSGLSLAVCEPGEDYSAPGTVAVKTEHISPGLSIFSFRVRAREWRRLSSVEREVEVPVPAISAEIMSRGSVMVYLSEGARHLALPFTYYQVGRASFFQPSYEEGKVVLTILGHFILNVNAGYTFRVVVVSGERLARSGNGNWSNYDEVLRMLPGE